ncbi:hypothetical protein ADUPG1_013982 [Aduncisulcus paluster]|uniref:Sfi1 spindle body domain-containing protein n=1 Tax=Aduncisulcus paluster TaxID=2918883 RepID=A0ABQ5K581_9EUKA|nr:hypothetical protein ADUPG1_013982 [Aduncisulcus paluster]
MEHFKAPLSPISPIKRKKSEIKNISVYTGEKSHSKHKIKYTYNPIIDASGITSESLSTDPTIPSYDIPLRHINSSDLGYFLFKKNIRIGRYYFRIWRTSAQRYLLERRQQGVFRDRIRHFIMHKNESICRSAFIWWKYLALSHRDKLIQEMRAEGCYILQKVRNQITLSSFLKLWRSKFTHSFKIRIACKLVKDRQDFKFCQKYFRLWHYFTNQIHLHREMKNILIDSCLSFPTKPLLIGEWFQSTSDATRARKVLKLWKKMTLLASRESYFNICHSHFILKSSLWKWINKIYQARNWRRAAVHEELLFKKKCRNFLISIRSRYSLLLHGEHVIRSHMNHRYLCCAINIWYRQTICQQQDHYNCANESVGAVSDILERTFAMVAKRRRYFRIYIVDTSDSDSGYPSDDRRGLAGSWFLDTMIAHTGKNILIKWKEAALRKEQRMASVLRKQRLRILYQILNSRIKLDFQKRYLGIWWLKATEKRVQREKEENERIQRIEEWRKKEEEQYLIRKRKENAKPIISSIIRESSSPLVEIQQTKSSNLISPEKTLLLKKLELERDRIFSILGQNEKLPAKDLISSHPIVMNAEDQPSREHEDDCVDPIPIQESEADITKPYESESSSSSSYEYSALSEEESMSRTIINDSHSTSGSEYIDLTQEKEKDFGWGFYKRYL